MPGLYGILDMAKWATLTQQANISVVSHNISNVNTPGYSRQKVILGAAIPVTTEAGQMGTGVRTVTVQREYDNFVGVQLNFETQLLGNWKALNYSFQRVEEIFNESSEYGLSGVMDEYWNAWQALADNPSGQAERAALVNIAETMSNDFNKMYNDFHTLQTDVNNSIKGTVDEINTLTDQIVELNEKISRIEVSDDMANDFRDQRDGLMNELAEKIGYDYLEDDLGQVSIFLENGNPLVQARMKWELDVEINTANGNFYDVTWNDGSGTLTPITDNITRGELSGMLEMRDTIIPDYLSKVDRLAGGIINATNQLHYNGYGLDGSTENNFFLPLSVATGVSEDNTGDGGITSDPSDSVYDNTVLTLDDYEIRFGAGNTFEIYNVTEGVLVDEARVDGSVIGGGSFGYTSGSTIQFEGIEVRITDGALGGPLDGDVFTVSSTGDAAKNMTVNPEIAGDVTKIAAAEGVEGDDNVNALAIAVLRDGNTMNNNTTSFSSYYSGLVGEVGVDVQGASRNLVYRETMVEQLNTRKESVSGVNLDEEAVNLMRYQAAFTAAARMITVVDELIQELLNLA
jgi:flagellar hook-associated protein 1 FlgK